ncbi:MAG: cadmium-translocating P-type ATPase [Cytophagales bacterium]|nr:cadmium-translocating P-type ATPase [Cytophagales bacterium]
MSTPPIPPLPAVPVAPQTTPAACTPAGTDDCCGSPPAPGPAAAASPSPVAQYLPAAASLLLLGLGLGLEHWRVAWFTLPVQGVVFGAAYLLVGGHVLRLAVRHLRRGQPFNEFFLMSLATLGAFAIGEYAEGVSVMLFYVIGEHFQGAAVARSRRSIKALLDNRPQQVHLLKHGQPVAVDPRQVRPGDVIQVKAGERVALDGVVLGEGSDFDVAALTGEPRPETRKRGEAVPAGAINLSRVADLRVTARYEDSALAKVLQLVEEAAGRKAKTQLFISRFAKVYTPIVVGLATAITLLPYFFVTDYVFADWLYRALVFLVISCPCALVVSIPLGYFGGIGAASRQGILFKGATYLDLIAKADTVVLDKTGTLTEGVFAVQEVVTQGLSETELVSLAAALESKSNHPVARAVAAVGGAATALPVTEVEELAGHGIRGRVAGRPVVLGNARLFRQLGIAYPAEADSRAGTVVLAALDGRYAGLFVLGDRLRPDAIRGVAALRKAGVTRVVMLSGDRQAAVDAVARPLGIDEAYGDLLPADKVTHLEALRAPGRTVAFAGDGINDAPVLARADVGIAMGGRGADLAVEAADVVIATDQPLKLAAAIRIGRRTRQIVWQNIGLAFGVKLGVMLLGAFGVATLWEAVFADVGVALLAILNAIRVGRGI